MNVTTFHIHRLCFGCAVTFFGFLIIKYSGEIISRKRFHNSASEKQPYNPSIDVDVKSLGRKTDTDLRVFVITYNRPASLLRLLDSLNAVDFLNDHVCIEVWIDMSMEGNIPYDTYAAATSFKFDKGDIQVINHTRHVGIYGQWMGLWQPPHGSKEIAVILEDDLTVSPLFYRYLKNVHKKYDKHEKVNGYSLQCVMKHGGENGNIHASDENIVFTYPIIGTWGFSPKRNSWVNFTKWYKSVFTNQTFQPLVVGIIPTAWYKGLIEIGQADTMWEMWHIFYAWKNKEVTLFPNLQQCNGFVKNWREIGLHFKKKSKITDKLQMHWDERFDQLPDRPIHVSVQGNTMAPYIDVHIDE